MRPHLILTALTVLAACDNECSFHERCDGDFLQICGAGPDQMFHRRIEETACAEQYLDGICVEIDEQSAACASAPATACDPAAFEPSCDGDLLISCQGVWYTEPVDYPAGYEAWTDCAAQGMSCLDGRCEAGPADTGE